MKNTHSIASAVKAVLAVVLFSLGFSRAAAHVDPTANSATQVSHETIVSYESPSCISPR